VAGRFIPWGGAKATTPYISDFYTSFSEMHLSMDHGRLSTTILDRIGLEDYPTGLGERILLPIRSKP